MARPAAVADEPLVLQDLTTRLGTFELERCNQTLARGRVTALLGGNGAGKSTLLGTVMGLVRRAAGTARIGAVDHLRNETAFKQLVGFAAQTPSFYSAMRLRRLLGFTAAFWPSWNDDLCAALLRRLRLQENQRIGEMSVGTRKKVAVLLAFGHEPDFVLLDEPTAGLDPASRRDVLGLLQDVAAAGRGVVFSTHIAEEVERVADDLLLIDRGKVVERTTMVDFRRRSDGRRTLEDHVIELTAQDV